MKNNNKMMEMILIDLFPTYDDSDYMLVYLYPIIAMDSRFNHKLVINFKILMFDL